MAGHSTRPSAGRSSSWTSLQQRFGQEQHTTAFHIKLREPSLGEKTVAICRTSRSIGHFLTVHKCAGLRDNYSSPILPQRSPTCPRIRHELEGLRQMTDVISETQMFKLQEALSRAEEDVARIREHLAEVRERRAAL